MGGANSKRAPLCLGEKVNGERSGGGTGGVEVGGGADRTPLSQNPDDFQVLVKSEPRGSGLGRGLSFSYAEVQDSPIFLLEGNPLGDTPTLPAPRGVPSICRVKKGRDLGFQTRGPPTLPPSDYTQE